MQIPYDPAINIFPFPVYRDECNFSTYNRVGKRKTNQVMRNKELLRFYALVGKLKLGEHCPQIEADIRLVYQSSKMLI